MHPSVSVPDVATHIGDSVSQGFQERHQVFVLLPRAPWPLWTNFTERNRVGLHRQIDLGVNVGRADRHMPKPGADGVDVHSCKDQMTGRRVSDHMRRDRAARERWNLRSTALDQAIDPEARIPCPQPADKDRCVHFAMPDFVRKSPLGFGP